jgi:hypothetical protein
VRFKQLRTSSLELMMKMKPSLVPAAVKSGWMLMDSTTEVLVFS